MTSSACPDKTDSFSQHLGEGAQRFDSHKPARMRASSATRFTHEEKRIPPE